MRSKKVLAYLLLYLFLFSNPLWAMAPFESFYVFGIAPAVSEDLSLAKEKAIEDGCRKALKEAFGYFLTDEFIEYGEKILNSPPFSLPKNFIENYEVVSEEKIGPIYRVKLGVCIDMRKRYTELRRLGFSMILKKPYKILCVNIKSGYEKDKFVEFLKDEMEESGFSLITISADSSDIEDLATFETKSLDEAKKVGAKLLLIIESNIEFVGTIKGTTLNAYKGNFKSTVWEVSSGEKMWEYETKSASLNLLKEKAEDEALRKGAFDISKNLYTFLSQRFFPEKKEEKVVEVSGLSDFYEFVQFKKWLFKLDPIISIYDLSYNDKGGKILVVKRKDTPSLFDELSFKTFLGKELMLSFSGKTLKIEVKKEGAN